MSFHEDVHPSRGLMFEGEDILSVWSTLELAQAAFKRQAVPAEHGIWYTIKEADVDSGLEPIDKSYEPVV